jgi:hypothetical protein
MSDTSEYKPPPKKRKVVAWLSALAGLALANLSADSFVSGKSHAAAWALLVTGIAFLGFSLWWAAGKR